MSLKHRNYGSFGITLRERMAKRQKVPMSANGGVTGSSDDYRDTWVDYKTAVTAKEEHNASGIGFKVPDNMYFLDIDGKPLDDSLSQGSITEM